MDAVVLSNISKLYPGQKVPALKPFSMTISTGAVTGLIGPDGAGKTTLMRLMTGLLTLTEGEISVYGLDTITQAPQIHDILGYMPQKFGLYEDLTVQENMNLYAKLKNIPSHEMYSVFEKMLKFTDLERFRDRLAGKLSGGMKQKLGLSCALMGNPKLLLLDEPSVGVDPISRRELWAMVKDIASHDMAVVWSTAYLDEAEKCDQVLLLNEGEVLFSGMPQDLTHQVKDRVFLVTPPDHQRRDLLNKILCHPAVIDGVIQSSQIRVVLRQNYQSSPIVDFGLEEITQPTVSRFEDAFVDILKNKMQQDVSCVSILAENINQKVVMEQAPIQAINLTKKFGDFTAAGDINFTIKQGEIFGLLGPNGAGKSTTFKMLCSLLTPTHGQALVLGVDLKTASSLAKMRIGYMAQKFSLYSDLSVRQNLNFFSGVYGLRGAIQQEKIREMIESFELESLVNTNAGILPLGFKQRLALACSVMHEPDILFLDEPTSGVDPLTRREFWLHINQMVQKGMTIMVTTHFMDEAENCDRIALIYRGKNIALGTPDDLKKMVRSLVLKSPTLEDAFITLVKEDEKRLHQNGGA